MQFKSLASVTFVLALLSPAMAATNGTQPSGGAGGNGTAPPTASPPAPTGPPQQTGAASAMLPVIEFAAVAAAVAAVL